MTAPMDTTHGCPGGCGAGVAREKFACPECWGRLPGALRRAIRSAHQARDFHAHVQAMKVARRWYRTYGD